MKNLLSIFCLVFTPALFVGCQSALPPAIIDVLLEPPKQEDAVDFESVKIIRDEKWDQINGVIIQIHLPSDYHRGSASDRTFEIEELGFHVGIGNTWFRDRFSLKLTAKGYWKGNRDAESFFVASKFVAYPGAMEFRSSDPKAKAWIDDQVQALWRDLRQNITDVR